MARGLALGAPYCSRLVSGWFRHGGTPRYCAFRHEFVELREICKGEIMNRVFGDKDSQLLSDSTETADLSTRRVWVKPVLERLSLQDALSQGGVKTDGVEAS
jgi:hypothetical protein